MEPDLLSAETVENVIAEPGPYAGYSHLKVRRRMSNFLLGSVKLNRVRLGYRYLIDNKVYLLTAPVVAGIAAATASLDDPWSLHGAATRVAFLSGTMILLLLVAYAYLRLRPRPIYLVDFACYGPPQHLQITRSEFVQLAERSGQFNDEALEFQRRVLEKSGIGDESYMPRTVFSAGKRVALQEGREEAAMVMFGAIDHLLAATRIKAKDIKILVVNCGVLNTTPSLSAMIVNHYKLKPDVNSYNLGGMGCAAGGIAVHLASDLLASHTASSALGLGAYALVVSTEIVSSTWYGGNDLGMLLPNCYLRMGAAALLLSNGRLERWRGKYELKQVVRTHMGGGMDERSFRWVELAEDKTGRMGLRLVRDRQRLLEIGGQAVEANTRMLGLMNKKQCGRRRLGLEHVCVQASSREVLDEVQSKLGLREECMEASRRTLERFGNTSSSSVWYELALLEAEGRVEAGDRIWQVAMGSGFKCSGMVWKALRKTKPASSGTNPWVPPHP